MGNNQASGLLLLISLGLWLLAAPVALASPQADYKRALKEFQADQYRTAYRKALSSARKTKGLAKEKAYAVAGSAALELGKEKTAKKIFRKLLAKDPDLDIPSAVHTAKLKRFLKTLKDDQGESISGEIFPAYTPFGLNQYQQGKTVFAVAFGAAQVAFLFLGYQQYQEANRADEDAMATYQAAVKSGNDVNPTFLSFLDANEAFVRKARQDSQRYFLLAFLTYGVSVYDAMSEPKRRVTWELIPLETPSTRLAQFSPSIGLQLRWTL